MIYVAVEPYAPAAEAPGLHRRQYRPQQRTLCGRRGRCAGEDRALDSTPRRFRHILETASSPNRPRSRSTRSLTKVETDVAGVELKMFVLDALGPKAHGYVAKPAKEGKFPALIQLQYAGVYALNARGAAQRAAEGWLFINVDSHDKLPSDASGNIPRNYQAHRQHRSREIVFSEHVPARLACLGLSAHPARLGWQNDRAHRRQHGWTTESRARRPAAGEDHRRAGLCAGRG